MRKEICIGLVLQPGSILADLLGLQLHMVNSLLLPYSLARLCFCSYAVCICVMPYHLTLHSPVLDMCEYLTYAHREASRDFFG